VAVSGNKKITAVRKIGSGSLHPDSLVSMLKVRHFLLLYNFEVYNFLFKQTGSEVGAVVNTILMNKLLEEETLVISQKVGFMR